MATSNIVKTIRDLMRPDAGISGDAQRIEQMTWLFFLKVYDNLEANWEFINPDYQSVIPEKYRWRNWAVEDEKGHSLTGDDLISFMEDLFYTLKNLPVTNEMPVSKRIVKTVFTDINQYMKDGTQLRAVVNVVNGINFDDAKERHLFGEIYEGILKDLQAAGSYGEFYTPRALTQFIIDKLHPTIGETVGDFACGTGGFLTAAINYMATQQQGTAAYEALQNAIYGQELKPLPYLLAITNMLIHEIENPHIVRGNSFKKKMEEITDAEKVDVIAMNPPYGGSSTAADKLSFPLEFRSSETADLFMVLIMNRLAENGRAGVILPDGFLFATEGSKYNIKAELCKQFNLHTIIRLPGSIFAPYTSINTNILFFDNCRAEDADETNATSKIWFYRLDMPNGYKHFSKTKPMLREHCKPIDEWWDDRKEIIDADGNYQARCLTIDEVINLRYDFDQCKFPKDEEEILPPAELLADYFKRRAALDKEIDDTLAEIQRILGIDLPAAGKA